MIVTAVPAVPTVAVLSVVAASNVVGITVVLRIMGIVVRVSCSTIFWMISSDTRFFEPIVPIFVTLPSFPFAMFVVPVSAIILFATVATLSIS